MLIDLRLAPSPDDHEANCLRSKSILILLVLRPALTPKFLTGEPTAADYNYRGEECDEYA